MRRILLFLWLISFGFPYKILVFNPLFAHSHSTFLARIADVLVENGFNVTSLEPVMSSNVVAGSKFSNVINVEYSEEANVYHKEHVATGINLLEMDNFDPVLNIMGGRLRGHVFSLNCRHLLNQIELIERLKNEQYDVMILEHFHMCGMGLSHILQPKSVIAVSSTGLFGHQFDDFGVPASLSYNPSHYTVSLDVHSFWSRAKNIYAEVLERLFFKALIDDTQALFRELYGDGFPTFTALSSRVAYVLVNSDPLIDYATPTLNRVIYIPGIGSNNPKKLDERWESIMTKRDRVVLFSLGSIAKSSMLSDAAKHSILKTMSRFPNVTFIWKYEEPQDDFSTKYVSLIDNVIISQWMPQADLLNHERTVAFITHGGMASTQELIASGTPGVFIPLFGDQPRNAGMMERNGLGKVFNKFELHDDEKLTKTVGDVIDNEKFRRNAKQISKVVSNRPFSSKELLVKYTEFAAEFGPSSSLRPLSMDMDWIEYHNADIIFVGLTLAIVISYLNIKIFLRYCL